MQERPKHWDEFYSDFRHFGNLRVSVDGVQYSAADIVSCKVERYLSDSGPGAGNACAACLTLRIIPREPVPRAACVRLYYQLRLMAAATEFIRKGTFYVSKRRQDGRILVLECYDTMLKAEQEFLTEETTDDWPKSADQVVAEIAARMGLSVDRRNMDLSPACYNVGLPAGLTMREVLQDIAARAGGNWCVSTLDTLRLVPVQGTGDRLPEVKGAPSVYPPMTIAGVRLWADSESYWPSPSPLPEGDILDAMATDATPEGAATLYGNVAGTVYRPYESKGRRIDPVCELGDTVPIGGTDYLAWRMVERLCQSYTADLAAPVEDSETEEEYPFLTQAERLNKRVGKLATTVSSITKSQQQIEMRVETVEGESQSLAEASGEHSKQLAALTLNLDGFKTEVKNDYSTTVQMNSAIEQSAQKIRLSVTNNGTSSVLTLSYSGTTLSSQNVEITGFVTFASLSESGKSTINGDNITTGTIRAQLTSVSSDAGSVKIYSGGVYSFDKNGTYRIGLFTSSSTNNTVLQFKDSSGSWCGDLVGYRENGIGIVQLNLSENGFFRTGRIQTQEIAIGGMKCFCDGYRALNGNAFVYLDGSARVGCFEKMAISGAAAQDVHWVWSGTLGGWVLTTATSLN